MYHQLYMIDSCIIELISHYYFDIVTSMGILSSSIYMSHILGVEGRIKSMLSGYSLDAEFNSASNELPSSKFD